MNQRKGHVLVAVGVGLLALLGLVGALGATGAAVPASTTSDVAEGLVGHWKFDEISGTVAVDSSGLENHGTLTNGPVYSTTTPPLWVPNVYANDLDGDNDYIVAPDIDLSNRSFSVAFWARRDITGTGDFVVSQGDIGDYLGLQIGFRDSDLFTFAFWEDDLDTPTTYTDSDWHHWACTYNTDTDERIIYFDGTPVASDYPSDDYQGSGPLIIGSYFYPEYFFDGLVDEVRVYTRTLGALEVVELASREFAGRPTVLFFGKDPSEADRLEDLDVTVAELVSVTGISQAYLSQFDVFYIGYTAELEGGTLNDKATDIQGYIESGGGIVLEQPSVTGYVCGFLPAGFEVHVTDTWWDAYTPLGITQAGETHAMLAGLTGDDLSGNFDTVHDSDLGSSYVRLAQVLDYPDDIALAAGEYGAGRIVFHTGNISLSSMQPGSDAYVWRMLEWVAGRAHVFLPLMLR